MGTAICGRCGAWVNDQAWRCRSCGRLMPGFFGQKRWLDLVFSKSRSQARVLVAVLAVVYVLELYLSFITQLHGGRPGFGIDPNGAGLIRIGALISWDEPMEFLGHSTRSEPWRIVTATLLHGSVLHILMNGMSLLTLGLFIEELFGPARFWILFTLTGIFGNVAALYLQGDSILVGASGGIFGLIGAMLGWGVRRGGVFGAQVRQQTIRWLIWGAIISFVPSIGWSAHAGGAVSGFLLSYTMKLPDSRSARESDGARFLGVGCMALLAVSMVLALISAAHWKF